MSLTSQLISGSVQALNLIKNYINNPRISFDAAEGALGYPFPDPASIVVILGASFHEIGDDDISSQLIVNETSGGKAWITDNIAPKPRMWELSGYIGPSPSKAVLNVFNGITIGELATPLLQDDLQKSKNLLRSMRTSRQVLVFQTPNGEELIWVGIKHLDLEKQPLVQNQIPVVMTLQEVPILQFGYGASAGFPSGSTNVSADPVSQGLSNALQVSNFAGVLTAVGL
jgi:hypothetical protein